MAAHLWTQNFSTPSSDVPHTAVTFAFSDVLMVTQHDATVTVHLAKGGCSTPISWPLDTADEARRLHDALVSAWGDWKSVMLLCGEDG